MVWYVLVPTLGHVRVGNKVLKLYYLLYDEYLVIQYELVLVKS